MMHHICTCNYFYTVQAVQEIRQLEDGMFVALSDQTTAEKSTCESKYLGSVTLPTLCR
jgi:hypothetical protein